MAAFRLVSAGGLHLARRSSLLGCKPASARALACMAKRYGSKSGKVPDENPLKEIFSATGQKEMGKIYDKKPFKFMCEKDKVYHWCCCGHSHNQPFCDGTHKDNQLKIKLRPVRFLATETKEYWFCNCKQTSKRPFCDGTHKRQDIQDAIKN